MADLDALPHKWFDLPIGAWVNGHQREKAREALEDAARYQIAKDMLTQGYAFVEGTFSVTWKLGGGVASAAGIPLDYLNLEGVGSC